MMSVNGRPSLPSRSTVKRIVAAAVVAGFSAGLPVAAASGASAQPVAAVKAAPAGYTVAAGDSLSGIAASHHVQGGWQKLYDLNKSVLTAGPNAIFPGEHLTLGGTAPAAPKSAPAPAKAATTSATSVQFTAVPVAATNTPGSLQALAAQIVPADQLASFDQIISHESGWNVSATNPSSGAYGLCQALPGSKMASAGADWRTNPATQMRWALSYMNTTYGSPNQAWAFWQIHHAY